jgi:hypothetical protein
MWVFASAELQLVRVEVGVRVWAKSFPPQKYTMVSTMIVMAQKMMALTVHLEHHVAVAPRSESALRANNLATALVSGMPVPVQQMPRLKLVMVKTMIAMARPIQVVPV